MRITRKAVLASVATVSVLALAACTGADEGAGGGAGDDDNAGINTDTALNIAWDQPFSSANTESTTGNATKNAVVMYMANSRFNDYDHDLNLVIDESFGTYTKVSDDPLTIEYTYADTAQWSDGVAAGPADLLLEWAAQSGKFNNVEAEYDAEGNVVNQDAIDAGIFFDASNPAVALIEDTPEIDGDSITFVYSKPFADWETAIDNNLPAHIVAQRALGIEDAEEATDALVSAITENNSEDLAKIAKVWSDDWNFASLPDDPQLLVTSGPYNISEFVEEQYLTLTANPEYKGDHEAVFNKVTLRYNGDPMGQVQALQNGEVDLISPQATADVLTALEAIDGLEVESNIEGTYEHVDMQQANGGVFDPATYGGDAAKAQKVRQAFLKTIPRDKIVQDLISPLNPDAEVRNSFTQVPGSPMYDGIVGMNGQATEYGEVDIDGAKALLAEVGVPSVQVRMLFDPNNTRRTNQFEIIKQSAAQAGFDVVPYTVQVDWGTDLSNSTSFYDAALFGWQSTATAVTESDANYRTGATNNYYGYSNPEVDALYDELQTETDPAEQERILGEVEKHLIDDAFGVTIFQFPGVTAWNTSKVGNVQKISISPTIFYGFWEWTAGEAAAE
ncbi:ABC transporter family substrate-binding protein [Cellulomonas dongxiuzhuiae]|uniref:ABC transporter family substrate-binding protein n=1 Tax=Cellulomonas dongxiuzhuiae TaxID=2819979 RepID=A0ABX8GLF7_9CELL|nr:ABC transporter family substrate-binding protein [Cellulomonas dongxiuzhuiae]MBO3089000.1 ABC transporter family substrate-binding protein [Cellulomonas dongxiuzhuiae]MBO3096556.1 ABC transporter family substrate-binding protein [Cellulomonas dongxiuzhuiae]QWC16944.1 ABC transporter family substrate-binding protein [Cellulomonas dongxiuzhuiae]